MSKRLVFDLAKYVLAITLLASVIYLNWAPQNKKAEQAHAASTVALLAAPDGTGPLLAASATYPERTTPRGLGYVWQRHVVEGHEVRWAYFLAAFVIYLVALLITLFRWYVLVRAQDLPITLLGALRYGFIGVFFNTFLPGSVGGDIIKAAALARAQDRRTVAVATVIMDRVIALWGLVWFVAALGTIFWAAGLLEGNSKAASETIVAVAVAIVLASTAVWLLMGFLPEHRATIFAGRLERIPKVGVSAAEFWRAVWMYRKRQAAVWAVLCMSWVGHVGFVLTFYCCAHALWSTEMGDIPSLTQHFLLVPIGLVMQAVIPTPGGAGAGEWGFGALYLLFQASEANGVMGSLVQRIILWILGFVGFLVYVWLPPRVAAEGIKDQGPGISEEGIRDQGSGISKDRLSSLVPRP